MERQFWIDYCKSFVGAYEDYPFRDENWTIMRTASKKIFCMIYLRESHLCLNVKCVPMQADFWREVYSAVIPAYHMNKTHWNTIVLDGSMEEEVIFQMIADSYELVAKKSQSLKKQGN